MTIWRDVTSKKYNTTLWHM